MGYLDSWEYDAEHSQLAFRRAELSLKPGQLFEVEIYLWEPQAKMLRNFVNVVFPQGASFRCERVRPLTIAGLCRTIRDARK